MTPAVGSFESFLPAIPPRALVALGSMLARTREGLLAGWSRDLFVVVSGALDMLAPSAIRCLRVLKTPELLLKVSTPGDWASARKRTARAGRDRDRDRDR